MLITKTISVRVFNRVAYYESKGYTFEKHIVGNHKKLMVSRNLFVDIKVEDLVPTSNYKIEYKCDNCTKTYKTVYSNYVKKNLSKGDFCYRCSLKEYNSGELNHNFGKKLECGFKPGKENYSHINFRGSNNPNYNPNLTNEERLQKRDLLKNITWRNKVYKRDNYLCKICKTKGSGLEAHHLNGYTEFKKERFRTVNGITLCKEHHKQYHKTFGYKNSTKQKFKQFIKTLNNE